MVLLTAFALMLTTFWWLLRWLPAGCDQHSWLPQAIALTRFLWIPTLGIVVAATLLQAWILALLAIVLALSIICVDLLPYWGSLLARKTVNKQHKISRRLTEIGRTSSSASCTPQTTHSPHTPFNAHISSPQSPITLNVMTLNCKCGHADPEALVRTIKAYHIDILALQEITFRLLAKLKQAGLSQELPFYVTGVNHHDDNGGFNGVWTRIRPNATHPMTVRIPGADIPAAVIAYKDRTLCVASVHTKSPQRGCALWQQGIATLAELPDWFDAHVRGDQRGPDVSNESSSLNGGASETAASSPSPSAQAALALATEQVSTVSSLIMGDFNASIDHPTFRALLRSGLSDAAIEVGRGMKPTYPSWSVYPRIVLDHILMSDNVSASILERITIAKTDHCGLVSQIEIA